MRGQFGPMCIVAGIGSELEEQTRKRSVPFDLWLGYGGLWQHSGTCACWSPHNHHQRARDTSLHLLLVPCYAPPGFLPSTSSCSSLSVPISRPWCRKSSCTCRRWRDHLGSWWSWHRRSRFVNVRTVVRAILGPSLEGRGIRLTSLLKLTNLIRLN